MPGRKRCYSTLDVALALRPALLCSLLKKFPTFVVPEGATDAELHTAGVDACRTGRLPDELDEVLSSIHSLASRDGWDQIQREAGRLKLNLDLPGKGLTYAELAATAYLHDWPNNIGLLDACRSRAAMHSLTTFVYCRPTGDLRERLRPQSAARVAELKATLAAHFKRLGVSGGVNVDVLDHGTEIWAVVNYGQQGETPGGTFGLDAVTYNKVHGSLRMSTRLAREHNVYMEAFSRFLFGVSYAFVQDRRVVNLEPLNGEAVPLFRCQDVDGLAEIAPVEVGFLSLELPGHEMVWRSNGRASLLQLPLPGGRIVPSEAFAVTYTKLRYRLQERARYGFMKVQCGRTLKYGHEGDAAVVENYLRRRRFIRDTMGG